MLPLIVPYLHLESLWRQGEINVSDSSDFTIILNLDGDRNGRLRSFLFLLLGKTIRPGPKSVMLGSNHGILPLWPPPPPPSPTSPFCISLVCTGRGATEALQLWSRACGIQPHRVVVHSTPSLPRGGNRTKMPANASKRTATVDPPGTLNDPAGEEVAP